jgi:hypothetical protein
MSRSAPLALCALLAACATFPEVDAAERALAEGPAPRLLPTEEILARAALPGRAEAAAETVAARAARLRARAARLRATPVG